MHDTLTNIRRTCVISVGFESVGAEIEWRERKTYALDHTANGMGPIIIGMIKLRTRGRCGAQVCKRSACMMVVGKPQGKGPV
jgi:hypothetical protein